VIPADAAPIVLPAAPDAAAADLACEPLWPGEARVCVRFESGGARRVATRADLERWQVEPEALRAAMAEASAAHLQRAVLVPIPGMEPASWLRLTDPDGWAAAGVLRPDLLAERLGGLPVRVAVPAAGVLVAWRTADPDVDRVMAIGVREIHDQQGGPVSDHVWQWDGRAWTPFGRAVEAR
jgi:hypothetical protein